MFVCEIIEIMYVFDVCVCFFFESLSPIAREIIFVCFVCVCVYKKKEYESMCIYRAYKA